MLPGKIASVIVGHVPKEISGYIWFAIQKGAKVSAIVVNTEWQPSPLIQGSLEILITMKIVWENEKNIRILQEKVSRVNFKCYEDESAEIRQTIRAIVVDESGWSNKIIKYHFFIVSNCLFLFHSQGVWF